jgi:hypothetical protein
MRKQLSLLTVMSGSTRRDVTLGAVRIETD